MEHLLSIFLSLIYVCHVKKNNVSNQNIPHLFTLQKQQIREEITTMALNTLKKHMKNLF